MRYLSVLELDYVLEPAFFDKLPPSVFASEEGQQVWCFIPQVGICTFFFFTKKVIEDSVQCQLNLWHHFAYERHHLTTTGSKLITRY
jgi:hypothetical protein